MRKNSFIQGALILTVAGIIVKFIGGIQQNLSVKASWRRRDRPLPDGLSHLYAVPFHLIGRTSRGHFHHGGGKKRGE